MKKFILFLKNLISKTKALSLKFVKPSIAVVELLKAAIDSPLTPIVTALIPGGLDDLIATRLKISLPIVLQTLGYIEDSAGLTNDEIVQRALAKIKLFNNEQKDAAYHNISSLLSTYLSDGKLTWSEAIHLAEVTYRQSKK